MRKTSLPNLPNLLEFKIYQKINCIVQNTRNTSHNFRKIL